MEALRTDVKSPHTLDKTRNGRTEMFIGSAIPERTPAENARGVWHYFLSYANDEEDWISPSHEKEALALLRATVSLNFCYKPLWVGHGHS